MSENRDENRGENRGENRHRRRVLYIQLLQLYEYLMSHREIAIGYNKSIIAREHSRLMWNRLAKKLNCYREGANKSGFEWSKYWLDVKSKVKRKNRQINESQAKGEPTNLELNEIELKFLEIIGDDNGMPKEKVDPLQIPNEQSQDGRSRTSSTASEPLYLEVDKSENEDQQDDQNDMSIGSSSPRSIVSEDPPRPASTSEQGPRPDSSGTPSNVNLPRAGSVGPTRRRQQRQRQLRRFMTAAEARERLVASAQIRTRAEMATSRSVERAVTVLEELLSTVKRIETKLVAGATREDSQDIP